jgi:polyisoprenoid-binding protein YceI
MVRLMPDTARRYRIGPGSGRLLVRTSRQGFAAKVGHDLTIEVTRWSGEVDTGGDDPSAASVTATIELDSFAVREGTGGALPLTAKDKTEIDGNIRKVLASGRDTTATFTSTRVTPSGTGGTIEGNLRLNGVERPITVRVGTDGQHHRATASVVQSEFGIKPYTAFLGALKLKDQVVVEVDVELSKAQPA